MGLSVDGLYSRIAWLRTIKDKITFNGMSGVEVTFPLIEDVTMEVAQKYGVIMPGDASTKAVRAVFVIDPAGAIRTIIYYPLSTGRNFDELLPLIKALQTADAFGVATPADWRPGDRVIVPPAESCGVVADRMAGAEEGIDCEDWFFAPNRSARPTWRTPSAPSDAEGPRGTASTIAACAPTTVAVTTSTTVVTTAATIPAAFADAPAPPATAAYRPT